MRSEWATALDSLGKYETQFQLKFQEEDVVTVYRHNKVGLYINKYTLLFPSLKRITWDTSIMEGGVYDMEKLIESAENEEDFFKKYMVELI